jgi:Protein of unknown function (DUF2844)
MKAFVKFRNHSSWVLMLGAVLTLSMWSLPALAALGGDLNSVQEDKAQMRATVEVKQMDAYAIHEIKDAHGLQVREYVSATGKVFGVAWQGPFMPDLHQLLGSYLPQYSAAVKEEHTQHPGRRPLNIRQPGLVVETSGHMRAYYGRVYVPEMVPSAVNAGEIR